MTSPTNRGQFKKGADPRRHKFSRDECVQGFWRALESIASRHPDWVDAYGRHAACKFLRKRKRN
jgi:hypothetical protein